MSLTTESASKHDNLEQLSIENVLRIINEEDKTVAFAVEKAIPQITALSKAVYEKLKEGGRLFYIGAGTSGRLGVVDASECPPTYGVPFDMVIGIIAGGDGAIRKAVEFAEDDEQQAWKDLSAYNINNKDVVVGIAASGRTPYVIAGLEACNKAGITTGCITCNENTLLAQTANYPVAVLTGAECVTGSTRMKAGTAQKLVLNMLSTSVMIKLGKVKGNKMVDMQLTNHKLVNRAIGMVMAETNVSHEQAKSLLDTYGSVRKAVDAYLNTSD